jgi:hypothetical protein
VLKTAIFIYYDSGLNLSYSLLHVDLARVGIEKLTGADLNIDNELDEQV